MKKVIQMRLIHPPSLRRMTTINILAFDDEEREIA
jgi:hypothetical protein